MLRPTRVPQKPTQNHKNGSNEGEVANISSVGVTTAPPKGPFPSQWQGVGRDSKAGGGTLAGRVIAQPGERGKAGGPGAGEMGAAANTR